MSPLPVSAVETPRAPREADEARAPARGAAGGSAAWRGGLAGPLVAAVTVAWALVATRDAGLPLRDPDHVAALYLALVGGAMALLVGLDIVIRAGWPASGVRPSRAAIRRVRRERWTRGRALAVAAAVAGFYLTYLAYRNLKSVVPLLRPHADYDARLADLDRSLFAGHDPATLLHSALGTGIAAHVLSTVYAAFIVFLPLSLALVLVFTRDLRAALFLGTALSLNWLLGAGSYFLLPSLGPVYAEPGLFAALPVTEVTHLQAMLLDQRVAFLRDPAGSLPQAVAAFASLHISMSLTAAAAAHLLGLGRRVKLGLWIWLGLTSVATIYLGWHYVLDDLGGVVIAAGALVLARLLTGIGLAGIRAG